MNEENIQLTPEEAKASLGLATRLSEEYLMAQAQMEQEQTGAEMPMEGAEMPQGEGIAPEMPQTPSIDQEALKGEIIESVKNDLKEIVKEEMSSLREEIKNALDEED